MADSQVMRSVHLDSRERAFVSAALRRSVTQSSMVILFAISTTIWGLIGAVAYMDSPGSMESASSDCRIFSREFANRRSPSEREETVVDKAWVDGRGRGGARGRVAVGALDSSVEGQCALGTT